MFKGGRQEETGGCGVREMEYVAPRPLTWEIIWMVTCLPGKRGTMKDTSRGGGGEGGVSEFSVEELMLRCLRSIQVEMPKVQAFLLAKSWAGANRKY